MAKTETIKLKDLLVNTENYRFEPVVSQKEAIDTMIEDQRENLFNLAFHIVENGLNPNDRIQTVTSRHEPAKYNVVEGNRRTVSLKLLNNPDLIDGVGHTSLKKKFQKLHEKNKNDLIKEIECTVYDSPAEADKWIKLKHAGQSNGAGTVPWTGHQVQRFEEKVEGKSSTALQTIKILQASPDVPAAIKSQLGNLKITNLDRLIDDPDVRKFIGIEINDGIIQSNVDEKEVVKGLTQIATDLLRPGFSVNDIYTKEDRKDYLENFPKAKTPDTKKKAEKPWQFGGGSGAPSKPKPKPKRNPKDRDVLIPKDCILKIKNKKVNAIYYELQSLKLSKFANAAAVSFRVFIELSMDSYIEENSLPRVTKDSKLLVKVTEVANDLEKRDVADRHICKGIRSAANNKNDLLGVETWHAYVHNAKYSPTPPHLVTSWDNIQPFIERVWANIK